MTKITRNSITSLCVAALSVAAAGCGNPAGPLAPAPTAATSVRPPMSPVPPSAPVLMVVSGVVTEMTQAGPVPVEGVYVEVCGYDSALTDADGVYRLESVPSNTPLLYLQKAGYKAVSAPLVPGPSGRVDVRMERE